MKALDSESLLSSDPSDCTVGFANHCYESNSNTEEAIDTSSSHFIVLFSSR
jgi:hypothetical protein